MAGDLVSNFLGGIGELAKAQKRKRRPRRHRLPYIPVTMESSNGNTPLVDDMNGPPEGVVVPPKDIRGMSLFFVPVRRDCETN